VRIHGNRVGLRQTLVLLVDTAAHWQEWDGPSDVGSLYARNIGRLEVVIVTQQGREISTLRRVTMDHEFEPFSSQFLTQCENLA